MLIVLAAAGFGVVASRSPEPPERDPTGDVALAAATIEALLDPRSDRDPIATLPADFSAVTGVTPDREHAPDGTTRAVHVGGGCSTLWGDDNTRWDYSVGCKAHDLGYDLLRYASAKGEPLGAEPRRRLDKRLSDDMHAQCVINPRGSPELCHTVASLFSAGLVANSWHQSWGPPRPEPIATWAVALLVVILLLAVRLPAFTRRRTNPPPRSAHPLTDREADQARYLGFLRMLSLSALVVAESVLAFGPLLSISVASLWPLTWPLQLVPLFFFAGGNSNLLAWRATQAEGGGYGGYLAGRICWLIRPVLALVTAWLVVPLSLGLLDASDAAVAAFGRLVAQPLWLLGLYLLVVAATPALAWAHRWTPVSTPLAQLAVVLGFGMFSSGTIATHVGGIVLALLFSQLAFHYADGTLWQLSRWALVAVAISAFGALTLVTTVGGLTKSMIAEPAGTASFVPSALGVLLLGVVQVCLVTLPRAKGVRAVAESAAARAVRYAQSAPMTVYLVYLCATVMLAGLVGAASTAGLPITAVDWLARPRSLLALALLGVPTALTFLLFEWRKTPSGPHVARADSPWDIVAATLGTCYGAAGILGFAVTGLTGTGDPVVLLGLPLDPMASIIHLLLGWYLLHSVRIGTTSTPWPWLLAAVACVPPMLTTVSGTGIAVHGLTIVVAIAAATTGRRRALWFARTSQPATETARG